MQKTELGKQHQKELHGLKRDHKREVEVSACVPKVWGGISNTVTTGGWIAQKNPC